MKLPKKIMDKVKEKETFIRADLGDDFYEWITDPETEITRVSDYTKIIEVLSKAPD